jgi:hypothetical protein
MNQSSRLPGWLAAGGHTGEEPAPAPEPARDALLLDIGGDTGALAIYTSAERDRTEIEVSPAGDDHARTHNVVRSRQTGSATRHAAVFPALSAGDYAVWSDAVTRAGTVTIHGGHVTEFRLRLADRAASAPFRSRERLGRLLFRQSRPGAPGRPAGEVLTVTLPRRRAVLDSGRIVSGRCPSNSVRN